MGTANILWVDDEMESLKSQILFLEHKGYDVKSLSNGHDAIDYVKENIVDVVLLDESMPGISVAPPPSMTVAPPLGVTRWPRMSRIARVVGLRSVRLAAGSDWVVKLGLRKVRRCTCSLAACIHTTGPTGR